MRETNATRKRCPALAMLRTLAATSQGRWPRIAVPSWSTVLLAGFIGLADAEWASGDRAQAQRAYGNVVDHFPEGSYPPM